MHELTKVFVAGALGSFVGSWIEPKITPSLPASLQTGTMQTVVHASIAGVSGAIVWFALGKVIK